MMSEMLMIMLTAGLMGALTTGCTAVKRISDARPSRRAYAKMEVQPASTRIFVDSEYRGLVKRWVDQTVPLKPGKRRVELRADGFITRRFDLDVDAGEEIRLTVDMEPQLDNPVD